MRNKIVKELSEKYPLSRDDIGELYDLVVKKYKLFPDLSIPEQCEIIIKNSIQHATCIMIEYHNHMFEAKNTPEQIISEVFDSEQYKMLDFPSDNETEAIICAMEIYANQNKKPLQDNNFIVTRHPITFQPFDKLPAPPPPRTVGSYGKETFLTKWKASKEYLFSIFNKKKV